MSNIRPVTDLKNYAEVLCEVSTGAPVFLTENGRCAYVILDIRDYEKLQAEISLAGELSKGRQSGEKTGWLSSDDVRSHFSCNGK